MKPQIKDKGVYKRLSFETLGGDDPQRVDRCMKGLLREVVTPKYSVIFSREGTEVYKEIDRNTTGSMIRIRNMMTRLIVTYYTPIKHKKAILKPLADIGDMKDSHQGDFDPNARAASPEVYIYG